jgi:hypothetical protein
MVPGYFKLKIAKPCTENWDNMTPDEAGRFCHSCSKHVIDFSILSDTEIQNYFFNNYNKPTCGRFKNVQLERITIKLPGYFFEKKIPLWQKYLIVFLICFGSNLYSIDVNIVGKQNALYAQTSTASVSIEKQTTVKSKKKKKKRKKETQFPEIIFHESKFETWGLVFPDYIPPRSVPAIINIFSNEPSPKDSNSPAETIKSHYDVQDSTPPPEEKKPRQNWEFILPAAFRLKRKRN